MNLAQNTTKRPRQRAHLVTREFSREERKWLRYHPCREPMPCVQKVFPYAFSARTGPMTWAVYRDPDESPPAQLNGELPHERFLVYGDINNPVSADEMARLVSERESALAPVWRALGVLALGSSSRRLAADEVVRFLDFAREHLHTAAARLAEERGAPERARSIWCVRFICTETTFDPIAEFGQFADLVLSCPQREQAEAKRMAEALERFNQETDAAAAE
jgi:hypothetical protein